MRLLSAAIALLLAFSVPGRSSFAASATGGDARAEKAPSRKRLTDGQIKKILIDESIADYEGNCPCPYSRASNGSRCGKRSAYSRPGGAAPLCYPADVTDDMVKAYREAHEET